MMFSLPLRHAILELQVIFKKLFFDEKVSKVVSDLSTLIFVRLKHTFSEKKNGKIDFPETSKNSVILFFDDMDFFENFKK